MVHCREETRLVFEPVEALPIADEIIRKELERHIAAENGVSSAIHISHSSFADFLDDLVVAQTAADHRSHGK
jgi:hypothetical protein